jgi:DNA replication and repair protein RecF
MMNQKQLEQVKRWEKEIAETGSLDAKLSWACFMQNNTYEKNIEIDKYEKVLKEKRKTDIKYAMTMTGPQRDDIGIYINDDDVRLYGSQGQQRTSALSLKLSEIELVRKIINDKPILLLDDVMSELDSKRRDALLGSIDDIQTIITCTGYDDFIKERLKVDKVYKISEGNIV